MVLDGKMCYLPAANVLKLTVQLISDPAFKQLQVVSENSTQSFSHNFLFKIESYISFIIIITQKKTTIVLEKKWDRQSLDSQITTDTKQALFLVNC